MKKFKVVDGVIEFENKKDYEVWKTLKRICNNLRKLLDTAEGFDWGVRLDLSIKTEKLKEMFRKMRETYDYYWELLTEQELKGLQ